MTRIVRFTGVLLVVLLAALATAAGYQLAGVLCAVMLAALLNRSHVSR